MWLLVCFACFGDLPSDKSDTGYDTSLPDVDDTGDPTWDSEGETDTAETDTVEVETGCQDDGDDDGWCGDTATPADCDDDDPDVHPGADEVCNEKDDDCDDEIDEGDVCDTTEPGPDPLSVEVDWDSVGVTVTITGGPGGGWEFGMAETAAGGEGWYGETCIGGDEPNGYDDYGYDVCHSLDASGGDVTSVYPDFRSVADGSTLFYQGLEANLTYALFATSSSECWVWGDDPSYYADFGCTEY